MLLGLIADVHSNAVALKEVLGSLNDVDMILSAGDVVGYNPYPDETIELFIEHGIRSICGNHDRAVVTGDTSGFNAYAAFAVMWTRKTLSAKGIHYLSALPPALRLSFDGKRIVIAHGSFSRDDAYVYTENFTPSMLEEADADVLVLGHTHVQGKSVFGERVIVNPGSVGQPRDNDPRAAFAVLDTDDGSVELRRVKYDVELVVGRVLEAGLPERLGARLMFGA